MTYTFTIRMATPDDDERIGQITVSAYVNGGHLGDDLQYAADLQNVALRRTQAELIVAQAVSADLLGSITICLAGTPLAEFSIAGEAEVRMLAVAEHAAGQGVGRALVEAGIAKARELGGHTLSLHTLRSMITAHRLYERLGFYRVPERDEVIEGTIELLAYELKL